MRPLVLLLAPLLVLGPAMPGAPQDAATQSGVSSQLEAFGALIVGTWEADDSRHIHEWGVGRRLIRSRSYFPAEGSWELVSEGIWYWDEEAQAIRGVHLAVGMPMDRMEYRSVVRGSDVVHDLRTYGGSAERYVETWSVEGEEYEWTLERPGEEGGERVMGGAYRRVEGEGAPRGNTLYPASAAQHAGIASRRSGTAGCNDPPPPWRPIPPTLSLTPLPRKVISVTTT